MSVTQTISDRWRSVWSVPKPGKGAAERHFAVLALGLVEALRQGLLGVREAWESGLNFKTYLGLKERHADPRLLELWEWAMELPQVEKLGDSALRGTYDKMECLAWDVISGGANRQRKTLKNMAAIRQRLAKKGKRFTHEEIKAAIEFGRR